MDDTGFPKQGRHSVGVARQYCGMLGKQDNCQVAVSVSLGCDGASVPVAWRLYLPKEWADDEARRDKAGVPENIEFATKTSIALAQLEHLVEQGAPKHCVLADAGYGAETAFRERLTALGLPYVVGITGQVTVWPPGREPLPPKPRQGPGRQATRLRRGEAADGQHRPQPVKELALELSPLQWYRVSWREGTNQSLRSRFTRLRVRAAHRDSRRDKLRPEEWLLIIDKRTLEVVAQVREPGRTLAHIEFTKDGRFALASQCENDGALIVYDAATFKEVKRLPMSKPVGKYNVWNKITRSEGTSH